MNLNAYSFTQEARRRIPMAMLITGQCSET